MDFGMHIKKHTPPETKSQPLFLKEVASVGVFELRPFQIEKRFTYHLPMDSARLCGVLGNGRLDF